VERDTLFSGHKASEAFLQRMMSLYVASHYRNTPNDLLLMSDAPAHRLFVLLGPVDEARNALPDVLAVAQVALEGAVSRRSAAASLAAGQLPQGDLIPWTVGQQFQDSEFPSLSGARIVRLATHPELPRAGYGSRVLELLRRYYEGEVADLGDEVIEGVRCFGVLTHVVHEQDHGLGLRAQHAEVSKGGGGQRGVTLHERATLLQAQMLEDPPVQIQISQGIVTKRPRGPTRHDAEGELIDLETLDGSEARLNELPAHLGDGIGIDEHIEVREGPLHTGSTGHTQRTTLEGDQRSTLRQCDDHGSDRCDGPGVANQVVMTDALEVGVLEACGTDVLGHVAPGPHQDVRGIGLWHVIAPFGPGRRGLFRCAEGSPEQQRIGNPPWSEGDGGGGRHQVLSHRAPPYEPTGRAPP
jgi:hypothetical protein